MSAEDNEILRLLEQARKADLPDQARLDRVRERLLPSAAGANQSVTPRPSRALHARHIGLVSKLSIGLGVAILVGAAATLALKHNPSTPAVEPPLQQATPEPEPEPKPELQPEPEPEEPKSLNVEPSRPATKPSVRLTPPTAASPRAKPTNEPADTEAALLRNAVLYLRNGQRDQARAVLATVQRRFPQSQLRAEHERLERWLSRLEREAEQQTPAQP